MIDILLATYNGEKYIQEQLDSIINQTNQKWNLIIRDDFSKDNTWDILRRNQEKYPQKFRIYKGNTNLGVVESYNFLLSKSSSTYLMFSDQDDIWLPDKIDRALSTVEKEEKKYPNTPILYNSDLILVDENKTKLSESFYNYLGVKKNIFSFYEVLSLNIVTGNTIMINKPLKDLIGSFPENSLMHDWWLALIAAKFGKIIFDFKPTILYRQHDKNVVGYKLKFKMILTYLKSFYLTLKQAKTFSLLYSVKINYVKILLIKLYLSLLRIYNAS